MIFLVVVYVLYIRTVFSMWRALASQSSGEEPYVVPARPPPPPPPAVSLKKIKENNKNQHARPLCSLHSSYDKWKKKYMSVHCNEWANYTTAIQTIECIFFGYLFPGICNFFSWTHLARMRAIGKTYLRVWAELHSCHVRTCSHSFFFIFTSQLLCQSGFFARPAATWSDQLI